MDSRVEMGLRKILGASVDVPEPMSRIEELLKQIAEQGISGGGSGGKGIQKIEKTSTQGLVDTYTITYTDATTSTFTITNGQDGEQGEPGQAGTPGENGVTPTIGENGNWFLGETDTGKPSRGEQGVPGQDGSDGAPGQTGSPGADGFSPTITENSGNTESVYKLDITTKAGSFTTPNLKGADGADGSGGGTSNYTGLTNKPQINSVELTGDKTADDLGLIAKNQGSTHNGKFMRVGADGNLTPYRLSSSDVGSRVFIADSSTTIATLWELMTNPNYDLTMLKIQANEGKSNSLYIIASGKRTDDNHCAFTTFPFFSNTTSGSESFTVVTISGAELDTIGESMEVHELAIPTIV